MTAAHQAELACPAAVEIPACREEFPRVKTWLNSWIAALQLNDKKRRSLLIAADEVFTNIASYAYPDKPGKVAIALQVLPEAGELELIFTDHGIAYNPLEAPTPAVTADLRERPIGGLGIFMVKKLMDHLSYRRENECNILTLTQYLTPRE